MTTAVVNSMNKKEQRVKNVFRVILQHKASSPMWEYAHDYAREGLRLEGNILKSWVYEMMYALSNLFQWRGDEARRCKKVLKKFGGVK